jgi:hypothetical protein
MELKTQALDRVLEALSPALAAELDRVVNETREALEQEFQKRLQAAVREAETAVKKTADSELQRAVNDARETTRRQVSDELEQRFKRTLEETTNRLKSEASSERDRLKSEATSERNRLQEQLHQWRTFADAQRQLGEVSSQAEILARFMKLADPYAGGLALYVNKADGLALWKHRGKAAFPEIISEETTDPESYFRTINVREKTVAAVCATPPFKAEVLDFLGSAMERAIEVFGLKLRAPAIKPLVTSEKTVAVSKGATSQAATPATPSAPEPEAGGADSQKIHAEARRTARLLISEIKLYHEDELREGREHSDIYDRLRKEIDSGREAYTSRVPKSVIANRDYFHEELVRILGDNDVSRLGRGYPGPKSS